MCILIGDAGSDREEEGDDVRIVAPPPKRSLSVKPKRKVKGRGGKKGGAKRGRKGATAAARRVTPIPILEEKEGKLPTIIIGSLLEFIAPIMLNFDPPSSLHSFIPSNACTCAHTFTYMSHTLKSHHYQCSLQRT